MALYREQGVVLRTYKLGETDRIVHLLTQGRGKVRAVVKGVRRPGSRFGGRLEPFSHVDLQLYSGRNLDIVTQAELITSFAAVRADFALSACGSTMVEAVDRVAQEDERANSLVLLLLAGLRALTREPSLPSVVLDAFLLRLASVAGYHPYLDACAACGTPGPHRVFGVAAGGVLCPSCAPPGSRPLDASALALLSQLAGTGWDGLDAAAAEPRARRAAAALVHSFLTYHLGRPLRAWELVPR
ncbi:MAG: DNA repair protein RecO [Actinomycetota bacterium]|jgi:DNA repair protein RecO (recombination protein O)|nr:DNA repair protein RecO [Actinomycetota bacterium]